MLRAGRGLLTGLLVGSLAITAVPGCKSNKKDESSLTDGVEFADPSEGQVQELGAFVAAAYAGSAGDAPGFLSAGSGSAYVALRQQGKLLGEAWGADGNMAESLAEALTKAKDLAGSATADMVEVNLAHGFVTVKSPGPDEIYKLASGKRVGIRGLELSYGDYYERVPPTKMIASAERFDAVVKRFLKKASVTHEEFVAGGGSARVFESHQILVRLPSGEGVELLRGNVLVDPSEVTKPNVQKTTDLMIEWMLTNLEADGRMTYLWMPEQSAEKQNDNNMIRQWMATNALIKVAEQRDDPELWARIAKNIDYNLEHFYEQDGEFGLIKYQSQVKLGSLSLAALAIISHPDRKRWEVQEHGLRRTVAHLWHEDGMFDCFYPARGESDRHTNVQNFYPGETMLLWAALYKQSRDPELLRRFTQSFRYYRDWHLDPSDAKRRRPSFIPWHTQADFIVWEVLVDPKSAAPEAPPTEGAPATEGPPTEGAPAVALTPEGWPVGTVPAKPADLRPAELEEFVFEMNDWLIDKMEVWEEAAMDDEKGRFHSRKTDYGVPHASATGVYIEGLIDAYEIAKRTGDSKRQARYALSLSRAMRSVMQIQFVDDVDMYYVTDRVRTKGGLRTDTIRPEVRVDNVQHVLMGVLKVLERFEPGEYKTD